MATKLDKLIASVAISVATKGTSDMMAEAAAVAAVVSPAEAAKLSQRWAPTVSFKAAGAPELRGEWPGCWYEALAEVLCQMQAAGVPGLLELWQQDSHDKYVVLIRLLRLAQQGVECEAILRSIEEHLPGARNGVVDHVFKLIPRWGGNKLVDLLRPLAHVQAGSSGDTVGTYITVFDEQRALKNRPAAPKQQPLDPIAQLIASAAALANNPDKFRERAQSVAAEIGPGKVSEVFQFLRKTSQTEAATILRRPPADGLHALIAWQMAIMEILSYLGPEALSAAWELLDDNQTPEHTPDKTHAVRLAVKIAALGTASQCEETIQVLTTRLSKLHGVGMRYAIFNLMDEAKTIPKIAEILASLGAVQVDDMDYEPQRVTIKSLVDEYNKAEEQQKQKVVPLENQLLADCFAQAIFTRNFEAAFAMLLPVEQAGKTVSDFAAEFDVACEHWGWPTACLPAEGSDLMAEDLRRPYSPHLPAYVTDDQFQNWMEVEYVPDEEADTDADYAFYIGFAVVKLDGELRIAACQLLDD